MARVAIVATIAITVASMITMNQAARFSAFGEGWVMPIVLMKAFEMSRRSFMAVQRFDVMVAGIGSLRVLLWLNRQGVGLHLYNQGLPERWQAHTL
jgi:hypothetical protein